MTAVKTGQSEGIPGAGILEQAIEKMLTNETCVNMRGCVIQ